MNSSTHTLEHCKHMRHRHRGAEMSEGAVPGSPGSRAGGDPAAALIFSTSLVSKSSCPGTRTGAAYQGETVAGEWITTGGFAFQALFTWGPNSEGLLNVAVREPFISALKKHRWQTCGTPLTFPGCFCYLTYSGSFWRWCASMQNIPSLETRNNLADDKLWVTM